MLTGINWILIGLNLNMSKSDIINIFVLIDMLE